MSVSEANAEYWNELCGTGLARSLGITDLNPDSLSRFDGAYFDYYPYLLPIVERAMGHGGKVLEIGLGFGSVGGWAAQRADEYHGVDIAESPVLLMRQRLEFLGLPAERVLQASALELPYAAETFDTVVSIGALHHTGDLPRAISEVHRVLRPGGHALVMVYNRNSFRRMVAVPRTRLAAARRRLRGSADEHLRAMYDTRTDGSAAPHTDFTSIRQARRLFSEFRHVSIQRRNFDDYRVRGLWLHRSWFLRGLDRVMGLDLYITARK